MAKAAHTTRAIMAVWPGDTPDELEVSLPWISEITPSSSVSASASPSVSGSSLGAGVVSDGSATVSVEPSLLGVGVGVGVVGEGDGAEVSPLLAAGIVLVVSIPIIGGLGRSGMLILVIMIMLMLKSSR
jgi:hypothetical protein